MLGCKKSDNFDADTEIPILKRSIFEAYMVKLMSPQKAVCGSVGACRAGNPEVGGSS